MKILFLALGEHPTQGGVDTYITNLRKALNKRGHRTELLCFSDVRRLPNDSIRKIIQYGDVLRNEFLGKIPSKMLDFEIQSFAHREILTHYGNGFDIIHSQNGITSDAARFIFPTHPIVGTIHGCFYEESIKGNWYTIPGHEDLFRKYDHLAVSKPDYVITPTSILNPNMPAIEELVHKVVHTGIDSDLFSPGDRLLNNKITISSSGSLSEAKGYDLLIKATHLLGNLKNQIELSIYGEGNDFERLSTMCNQLDVNINFRGHVSHSVLAYELSKSDIFIHPSRLENFSLSVLEAMSAGCALICSDVGGIREQIENGYNGFIFESENAASLSEYIRVLINNADLRSELAFNARQTVLNNFSLQKMGENYEEIYSLVLKKKIHINNKFI